MNRFAQVVRMPDDAPNMMGIAERFLYAVREATASGEDPDTDPAVMLIGAHIAFRVHVDVNTSLIYTELIDRCAARVDELPGAAQ